MCARYINVRTTLRAHAGFFLRFAMKAAEPGDAPTIKIVGRDNPLLTSPYKEEESAYQVQ